ncbi:MAG: 3-deoxy-D-manno-octulosonic acid transferase [Xanthobacteraceae bacterium]|nr:3-deoxy-D-manno-octulosonic acid transferase [Xanthobacteraceae bacterium]
MAAKDRLPITLRLYRGFTRSMAPFAGAWLKWRLRRGKEDPDRIEERRGLPSIPRPEGPLVWVHGASVGELLSILPLLNRIHARGFSVLLTSGTVTAARLAERRLPEGVLHQFVPLDAPAFVERFLDHWRPNLALIAESEFWPNLITEGWQRDIPFVLINGRLSSRSFERWRIMRKTATALLSRIDLCLAQEPEDARRLAGLGAKRIVTTGNLKFDVPPPPADPAALAALERTLRGRPVVLAASTHDGEEIMVIEAHLRLRRVMPNLLTIIAPRHPERGRNVIESAEEMGAVPVMRSRGHLPDRGTDIYVADTIGELRLFYRLAPIVFVGGSLVRHGGQNPIEPAKLDSAILHGPYVSNFATVYAQLTRARGAATVTDAKSLANSLARLLDDPDLVRQMAATARTTVDHLGGALDRTFAAIEPYLVQLRLGH